MTQRVAAVVTAADALGQLPVLVAYNIPKRDCGSYSSGGATNGLAYSAWIDAFATGIGSHPAVVILEPDAVASAGCLSSQEQNSRYGLLAGAIERLNSGGRTSVYLDAGNARWIDAPTMAARLLAAGVVAAHGFSVNVANFDTTASETAYGRELSALIGQKPFVIDTSRNGRGALADSGWCNPTGRALGALPGSETGDPRVEALLWIKHPGRSDGPCGRGEPPAGVFWPSYALALATAAGW
jgi:endoglucanase